jgi:membrane carboxypeptidase/penicillin-binding protein
MSSETRCFIGSTYGPEGITVAVRIGFDDNRSLGPLETGGRVALPVFKDLMLRVYREKLVGPAPTFPAQMEQNIDEYLAGGSAAIGESVNATNPASLLPPLSVGFTERDEASQQR